MMIYIWSFLGAFEKRAEKYSGTLIIWTKWDWNGLDCKKTDNHNYKKNYVKIMNSLNVKN